MLYSEDNL